MKLHEEFKLYETMWDELDDLWDTPPVDAEPIKEVVGFFDCSGSNGTRSKLAAQVERAKKLGVTSYYYFTDKIYTTPDTVSGSDTNYNAICRFAKKNAAKSIIVFTDSDIDHNPGGEELKALANVKIERIDN